jgi:hypothetical protein
VTIKKSRKGEIPVTEDLEDAGIEPRTVATFALTARRSNHSTIDLIPSTLYISSTLGLDLINNSAISHPQLG